MKKIAYALMFTWLFSQLSVYNKKDFDKLHVESGVNLTEFTNSEFNDVRKNKVDYLGKQGFSTLVLNPIFMQENLSSSRIEQESGFNWSHLEDIIKYSSSRGMQTVLKPMINSKTGESRTRIFPESENEWFNDYEKIMLKITDIANKYGSEKLIIACELDSLVSERKERFSDIAHKVREKGYEGEIGIAVVYNNDYSNELVKKAASMPLDFIGIDYYVYSQNDKLDDENKFFEHLYYLKNLESMIDKPIIITEIGYRSVANSNKKPMFNYRLKGEVDEESQLKSYNEFLKSITHKRLNNEKIKGIYFWVTENGSYIDDLDIDNKNSESTGYSIFGKKSEERIKEFNKERIYHFLNNQR